MEGFFMGTSLWSAHSPVLTMYNNLKLKDNVYNHNPSGGQPSIN